jgi:HSP20 family protein
MNFLRTREKAGVPVQSNALEPFRLMRDLLRWDPYRDIYSADQIVSSFMPSFDVEETEDSYVFTGDLPGIRKDDLDIQLAGNRLTITGKRESGGTKDGTKTYAQERVYGTFSRTWTMPEEVESKRVVAELRDGVLHLMVPKSPESRPQKIRVS